MCEWKKSLAGAIRNLDDLLSQLELRPVDLPYDLESASTFPLRVPREFVDRMEVGNPADPLLLQVLPLAQENSLQHGFTRDPVGELAQASSVLSKYDGRALVMATGACAVHCRYCFRRHFPYSELNRKALDQALGELASGCGLSEVILSGGDPLVLGNEQIASLIERCSQLAGLKRIRIHSRMPIVIPSRIDEGLLEVMCGVPHSIICVVHINHKNEIDDSVRSALERLRSCDIILLNQSVLLKGVNDSVEVQVELAEAVMDAGVLPYYLHLLDRVEGAAHFEVEESRAQEILAELRKRLPGYLIPRLVREIAGEPFKMPIE